MPQREQLNRRGEKAVHEALIRHSPVLSTGVNPTDGHRSGGGASSFADGDVHS